MEQPETEARDPGNYYHQNLRRMGFQEKRRIYNNAQEHCWEKLIEFAFQIVISSLPHFSWQQCYPFSCSTKKHEAILDLWRSLTRRISSSSGNFICWGFKMYLLGLLLTATLKYKLYMSPQFQEFQYWLLCSFIFPQDFFPPAHYIVSSFVTVACCLSPLTRIWIPWGQDSSSVSQGFSTSGPGT